LEPGLEGREIRVKTPVESQQQSDIRGGEAGACGACSVQVEIERLLAEHGLASRNRLQTLLEVQVRRACEDDPVYVGIVPHLVGIGENRRSLRGHLGGSWGGIDEVLQAKRGVCDDVSRVNAANSAGAKDSYVKHGNSVRHPRGRPGAPARTPL
jgi:hypothetical protein